MVLSQIEMRSSSAPASMTSKHALIHPDNARRPTRYVEGESEEEGDQTNIEPPLESGDEEGSVEDVELGGESEDGEDKDFNGDEEEGDEGIGEFGDESESDGSGPLLNEFADEDDDDEDESE